MKPLYFLALLTAVLFPFSMAHAEECYSPERNKQGFLDVFPNAVSTDLSGKEASDFIKTVKATHPDWPDKSLDVDAGQVFEVPGLPKIVISLLKDGCVSFTITMSPDSFMKYMTESMGSRT